MAARIGAGKGNLRQLTTYRQRLSEKRQSALGGNECLFSCREVSGVIHSPLLYWRLGGQGGTNDCRVIHSPHAGLASGALGRAARGSGQFETRAMFPYPHCSAPRTTQGGMNDCGVIRSPPARDLCGERPRGGASFCNPFPACPRSRSQQGAGPFCAYLAARGVDKF